MDIHVYFHDRVTDAADERIRECLRILRRLEARGALIMAELDDLRQQVRDTVGVEQSALVLIQGIQARIDAAIAAGGRPQDFIDMRSELGTSAAGLSAAVAANSPPVP